MHDAALADASPPASLVRRVFSLTGVLPLGVFLVLHAATNSRAVLGEQAFLATVRLHERIPALPLVEALFVFAPLLVHASVGAWLVARRVPLSEPSPYPRGVHGALRATGFVAVAFLAVHLPELRFRAPGTRPSGGELLTVLSSDLSATSHGVPWWGVLYLAATGCVTFHFVVGLWGFFARSRAGGAPRARRWAAWSAAVLGAVMWLSFANVVVLHASGARLFGAAASEPGSGEPCPATSAQ